MKALHSSLLLGAFPSRPPSRRTSCCSPTSLLLPHRLPRATAVGLWVPSRLPGPVRLHRRCAGLPLCRALQSENAEPSTSEGTPLLDSRALETSEFSAEADGWTAETVPVADMGNDASVGQESVELASAGVSEEDEKRTSVRNGQPVMAFMVGVLASARKGLDGLVTSEWLSWWPFWPVEKRLDRLVAEADANPKDAAKQSTLLAELNKYSPESVIRRFEQRNHSVDSKGVAEYLRALVVTNAIAEYLPDEGSGQPSTLPALVVLNSHCAISLIHQQFAQSPNGS